MCELITKMKNVEIIEPKVTVKSTVKSSKEEEFENLAQTIAKSVLG